MHGFRLLNGHDPAILDAAIAVIEFVRRRRRGILAKPSLIVRLRDTYGSGAVQLVAGSTIVQTS